MTTSSPALFSWVSPCIFSIFRISGLTDSFRRVTGFQVPFLRVREFPFGAGEMNNAGDPAGHGASGQKRMTQKSPSASLNVCVDCMFVILRKVRTGEGLGSRLTLQCLIVAMW